MAKNEKNIIEFTPEQLVGWEQYRQALYVQKTKSDDLFEKAITFIASGTLALTLTFHDKIVPITNAQYVIIIAIGWTLLVATLFVNLISHYKSSKSTDNSIDEIDDIMDYKLTYDGFRGKLNTRNTTIDRLNKASIVLLGIGLFAIIIYVSINIHNGKEEQSETAVQTTEQAATKNQYPESKRPFDSTAYVPTQ